MTLYPSHPDLLADQAAFLTLRQDGLYSTDSPAILGLSRYGSPRSVYLDKVEPPLVEVPNLQAWLGWQLEDAVAALWAERMGAEMPTKTGTATWEHPTITWLRTHLDYVTREGVLVEAKTRQRRGDAWGEDGTGKIPPDIWVQVQHQMAAAQTDLCYVCVLFGLGHAFHVYPIARDDVFLGHLIPRLEDFWVNNVQARVPPDLMAVPRDIAYSKRHAMEPGATLAQATPEQEALFRRVRMAALAVSQAEAAKEALDAQVRELIGTRAGLMGMFGEVTYKPTKGRTSWELVAGTYHKAVDALRGMVSRTPEVETIESQVELAEGLYTKPGSRTLRYSWSNAEGATDDE